MGIIGLTVWPVCVKVVLLSPLDPSSSGYQQGVCDGEGN